MFFSIIKTHPFIPAFILGLLPALIWMWFWLKEDRHPEPAKMLTLSFIGGMLAVLFVLPLQRFVYDRIIGYETTSFIIWAALEEIFKFGLIYIIALRNKAITDEPVDDMIYMIMGALGFIAFENTLFLIDPIQAGNIVNTIVTGNLRFMGASLVHIISSATIGFALALSFYKTQTAKAWYLVAGIASAIVLHTTFNLFIINEPEENILFILSGVWVGIVVLLLLFEKAKKLTISHYS